MNTTSSFRPRHRTRGSAFITVMLYSFLLLTLVATTLQWSLNERRMNMRASYFMEARNAAEAVAEYGFSQIATQFSSKSSVPTFDPQGTSPIVLPPTSGSNNFFAGSNVDTAAYSSSHPTGLEVIGGLVVSVPSNGSLCYIDPNDPNNINDPLKGQYIYRRDIEVLARATVIPPNGDKPSTAFIMEKISVRGAPLFANAIFYGDNDLEVHNGPTMDVWGPVHVNGNMFVSNQSPTTDTGLWFHGPVACSGNIYHAWANENHAGDGSGNEALRDNVQVGFVNTAGTMIAMKTSATGYWRDSTMGADSSLFASGFYINTTTPALTQLEALLSSNFRQTAIQTWGGNLQTAAMGVSDYNPVGAGGQVGVSGTTPIYANTDAADSLGYGPHAMIDPPNTSLSTGDTYYTAKKEVENQKFANKVGLYVQVAVTPGANGAADTATIKLFGWPGSAPNGTPANQVGPNGGILLGTVPSGLVSFIPYKATQVTVGNKLANNKYPITTTTYSSTTTTSATTYSASNPGNSQVVNSGLYDQRQDAGINLVQIDMAALRAALNDTINNNNDSKAIKDSSNSNVWGAGSSSGGYDPLLSGSTGWNGGIYVEVKTSDSSTTQTSIALANGQVDSGNSLIPTVNGAAGLTVATNAPMYVVGNFNADGNNITSATSATTPDDGKTDALGTATSAEVPVALANDAITILSPGYFGSAGADGSAAPTTNPTGTPTSATNSWSTPKPTASNVEVAAAFVTGLVQTTDTAMSGGAHNLPRFVESWQNLTVAIRGSLVVLYHSKIATAPWGTAFYYAPARNWGFDKIFSNGHFPPLTPKVMSYRRVDFTDWSPSKYANERGILWPSLP